MSLSNLQKKTFRESLPSLPTLVDPIDNSSKTSKSPTNLTKSKDFSVSQNITVTIGNKLPSKQSFEKEKPIANTKSIEGLTFKNPNKISRYNSITRRISFAYSSIT